MTPKTSIVLVEIQLAVIIGLLVCILERMK